jgi:hypothetical protein
LAPRAMGGWIGFLAPGWVVGLDCEDG